MKDPRTSAVLNELMDDKVELHEGNCPEKLVKLARQLEEELEKEREKVAKLRKVMEEAPEDELFTKVLEETK